MSIGADQNDMDAGATVPRPAPEVTDAVRQACRRLFAIESEFIDSFYTQLVHLVPAIRQTTHDQGRSVAEGLARSVLWAALTEDPADIIEVTFQTVGSEYHRQGFPTEGYHGAGHALLRSARSAYTAEWSSELSSGWVAYFAWLRAHLEAGAQHAEQTQRADAAAPIRDLDGGGVPQTLDDVLQRLRTRHFAGNERALGRLLTRIALRTGADLRAPRPDQRANPAVVANVTAVLQVMGYAVAQVAVAGAAHAQELPARRPEQARWWNRRKDAPERGWRRIVPGLFR